LETAETEIETEIETEKTEITEITKNFISTVTSLKRDHLYNKVTSKIRLHSQSNKYS